MHWAVFETNYEIILLRLLWCPTVREELNTDMWACVYWKRQTKNNRLPSTNKEFTLSFYHMRTHPWHLSAGARVTASPHLLLVLWGSTVKLVEKEGDEGGRWTHNTHPLADTKAPSPGQDSGRWDGVKLKTHPSSTCHSGANKKPGVHFGENTKNTTLRVTGQWNSVAGRDYGGVTG